MRIKSLWGCVGVGWPWEARALLSQRKMSGLSSGVQCRNLWPNVCCLYESCQLCVLILDSFFFFVSHWFGARLSVQSLITGFPYDPQGVTQYPHEIVGGYLWGLSSWVEVGESPKQELYSSVTELSSECASVQNLGCFILGTQNSHIMDRTQSAWVAVMESWSSDILRFNHDEL